MKYVDGFVLVVPTKKLAAYKKMATAAAEKFGASTARWNTSKPSAMTSR